MIADFVLQTANAPGTGATVTLIAPPAGRLAFSAKFANGAAVMYYLDDGSIFECGYATLTTGSPDTLSRDTVLSNSSGTTARLNFAGTTRVFNEIPAASMVYKDRSSILNTGVISVVDPSNSAATVTVSNTGAAGANIKLIGNGATTPNKFLRAISGAFQITNSAGSAILTLTDAGATTVTGALTATGGAAIGGALTGATTGAFSSGITATTLGLSSSLSCTSITASSLTSSGAITATNITGSGIVTASTVTIASPANGFLMLQAGTPTNTGYVGLYSAGGTRMGFVGFGPGSGMLNLQAESTTTGWTTNLALSVGTSLTVGTTVAAGGALTGASCGVTGNMTCVNLTATTNVSALGVIATNCAFSGNVAGATSSWTGVVTCNGSTANSGTSEYMITSGVANGAWTLNSSINCGNGVAATNFATTSDLRLKSDVKDLSAEQGYAWVQGARPRTYTMAGRPQAGFVAQEDIAAGRQDAILATPDEREMFRDGDGFAPPGHRLYRDYAMDNAFLTAEVKGLLARVKELEAR